MALTKKQARIGTRVEMLIDNKTQYTPRVVGTIVPPQEFINQWGIAMEDGCVATIWDRSSHLGTKVLQTPRKYLVCIQRAVVVGNELILLDKED